MGSTQRSAHPAPDRDLDRTMCSTADPTLDAGEDRLRCARAACWAMFEYSYFRSQPLCECIHRYMGDARFACGRDEFDLCLRRTMPERLCSQYDRLLGPCLLGLSAIRTLAAQLQALGQRLRRGADAPEGGRPKSRREPRLDQAVLLQLHWFVAQLASADAGQQRAMRQPALEAYAALEALRVWTIVRDFSRRTVRMTYEQLRRRVRAELELPEQLRRSTGLAELRRPLNARLDSVLASPTALAHFARADLRRQLLELCDRERSGLGRLETAVREFAGQCRPQIEIMFQNQSFLSGSGSELIEQLVALLRRATAAGHSDRIRAHALRACQVIELERERASAERRQRLKRRRERLDRCAPREPPTATGAEQTKPAGSEQTKPAGSEQPLPAPAPGSAREITVLSRMITDSEVRLKMRFVMILDGRPYKIFN